MKRDAAWKAAASAATPAGAYYSNGYVYVKTPSAGQVPLTGTTNGSLYGTERSTWVTLSAGQTKAYVAQFKL